MVDPMLLLLENPATDYNFYNYILKLSILTEGVRPLDQKVIGVKFCKIVQRFKAFFHKISNGTRMSFWFRNTVTCFHHARLGFYHHSGVNEFGDIIEGTEAPAADATDFTREAQFLVGELYCYTSAQPLSVR